MGNFISLSSLPQLFSPTTLYRRRYRGLPLSFFPHLYIEKQLSHYLAASLAYNQYPTHKPVSPFTPAISPCPSPHSPHHRLGPASGTDLANMLPPPFTHHVMSIHPSPRLIFETCLRRSLSACPHPDAPPKRTRLLYHPKFCKSKRMLSL